MKKIICMLAVALGLFGACTSTKSVYTLGGEWQVVNLQGTTITPTESTPFLGFDVNNGSLYGFTGCNRLTGTLDAGQFMKGKPDFSHLGMTRMFCQDDQYETKFVEALNQVKSAEVNADEMTLKNAEGKVVIVLQKKK